MDIRPKEYTLRQIGLLVGAFGFLFGSIFLGFFFYFLCIWYFFGDGLDSAQMIVSLGMSVGALLGYTVMVLGLRLARPSDLRFQKHFLQILGCVFLFLGGSYFLLPPDGTHGDYVGAVYMVTIGLFFIHVASSWGLSPVYLPGLAVKRLLPAPSASMGNILRDFAGLITLAILIFALLMGVFFALAYLINPTAFL